MNLKWMVYLRSQPVPRDLLMSTLSNISIQYWCIQNISYEYHIKYILSYARQYLNDLIGQTVIDCCNWLKNLKDEIGKVFTREQNGTRIRMECDLEILAIDTPSTWPFQNDLIMHHSAKLLFNHYASFF